MKTARKFNSKTSMMEEDYSCLFHQASTFQKQKELNFIIIGYILKHSVAMSQSRDI